MYKIATKAGDVCVMLDTIFEQKNEAMQRAGDIVRSGQASVASVRTFKKNGKMDMRTRDIIFSQKKYE